MKHGDGVRMGMLYCQICLPEGKAIGPLDLNCFYCLHPLKPQGMDSPTNVGVDGIRTCSNQPSPKKWNIISRYLKTQAVSMCSHDMFDMTSLGPSTGPKGDSAARFGEETHRGWKVGQVRRANSIWRSRNQQKKVGFDQDLQKKIETCMNYIKMIQKVWLRILFFWGHVYQIWPNQASEREVALKQELEAKVVAAEDRVLQSLGDWTISGLEGCEGLNSLSKLTNERKTWWMIDWGSFGARIGGVWGFLVPRSVDFLVGWEEEFGCQGANMFAGTKDRKRSKPPDTTSWGVCLVEASRKGLDVVCPCCRVGFFNGKSHLFQWMIQG